MNSPVFKLHVNSDNNGTVGANWIASTLGGLQKQGGSRDIEGVATIGSYSNALTAWSNIAINPNNYDNVSIGTLNAKVTDL